MSSYLINGKVTARPLEDDPELRELARKRQQEYLIDALLAKELNLDEPEVGRDIYMKACADLKRRGINPEDADAETLQAALAVHYG
jgi:hypothetical protein